MIRSLQRISFALFAVGILTLGISVVADATQCAGECTSAALGFALAPGSPIPVTTPAFTYAQYTMSSPDTLTILLAAQTIAIYLAATTFLILIALELTAPKPFLLPPKRRRKLSRR